MTLSRSPCFRPLPLLLTVLAAGFAAGCGSPPPKPVPPVAAAVPGSAAGPVYGKGTSEGKGFSPQMEAAERQLTSAMSGTGVSVARTTDERIWITLPGDLTFQPNRSALKPTATAVLDKIVLSLRGLPTADLRIVGHTDAKGAAAANDALSLDRAASTRDWLVARGMSPVRIAVAGRGSRDPLASNDDETGRATNRRVEILVGEKPRVSAATAK
ncbi:OmpA family protein [Rhizobacter sp. J219]|uniref:OmpA family protein n=1 Tax=Rhizobacter sp. J219 TaxID=2898430 RepID=UPI0021517B77|nr:OmpA family protein [Rhizobacter sp. J219]MCR5884280.1 OmpA family protein [Rhizobacter sp. J219]